MPQITTHRIAGITFRTEASVSFPQLRTGNFKPFLCADLEPDVRLQLHCTTHQAAPLEDHAGQPENSSSAVLAWRAKLLAMLDQAEQIEMSAGLKRAIIRNFSQRELDFFYAVETGSALVPGHSQAHPGFSWAPTLRQIFATFLPLFSAAMVHSSGVVRNNLTALFLAHSTGGKTTVTTLHDGNSILSDDQVILRADEQGQVAAHSTPFGRATQGPASAKLGGLFLLEKAKSFELKPFRPMDMLEYIWNSQMSQTYFLPTELRVQAYQMLSSTCRQVPCYVMRFPKEHVDWEAIDAAMAK